MSVEARRSFHHELDEVRDDLVRLGAMAAERIPRVTEVLLAFDLAEAQAIIEEDDEIDALALDIEERCYRLLALQQPMAVDLRAIVTAIRLTSEIERSADLSVNIAKAARRMYGMDYDPQLRGFVQQLGEEAHRLFSLAIDAYLDADAAVAAALDDMDDRLDNIHRDYIAQILESCRSTSIDVDAAVQLALIGRYYERIGDHAVNMGERIRYMVTGWMPEHTGAARLAARRDSDIVLDDDQPPAPSPAPDDG
jgi:phosphate transport system protein